MPSDFDPYYKWLGIPPRDQPPHHYRLLGIELFESDRDVIASACEQRMAHVRTRQLGKHQAESQQVLNEIAAARVCLLDKEKKAVYDQQLRDRLAVSPSPPAETDPASSIATSLPLVVGGEPAVIPSPTLAAAELVAKPVSKAGFLKEAKGPAKRLSSKHIAVMVVAATLIGIAVPAAFMFTKGTNATVSQEVAEEANAPAPAPAVPTGLATKPASATANPTTKTAETPKPGPPKPDAPTLEPPKLEPPDPEPPQPKPPKPKSPKPNRRKPARPKSGSNQSAKASGASEVATVTPPTDHGAPNATKDAAGDESSTEQNNSADTESEQAGMAETAEGESDENASEADVPAEDAPATPEKSAAAEKLQAKILDTFTGMFQGTWMERKTKKSKRLFWDIRPDNTVWEKDRQIGTWKANSLQLHIDFLESSQGTAVLRMKRRGLLTGPQTLQNGEIWAGELLKIYVVGKWEYHWGRDSNQRKLWSNGRIGTPDSAATWNISGTKITFHYPSGYVDKCTLGADGKSFEGTNQRGTRIWGKLISDN